MTDDARQTVWHTETIASNGSTNRIRHARGDVRGEITTAARTLLLNPLAVAERSNVDLGSASAAEVEQDRRDRAAWLYGRRGRKPEPYVEFILAGPPQYSSNECWDDAKEAQWAESCLAWVRSRFRDSLVVVASHHRDETAPHVHIVLSPRSIDDQDQPAWGWCKARNQAIDVAHIERERRQREEAHARENAERAELGMPALPPLCHPPRKNKAGARLAKRRAKVALSALQDDCHAHIGAPYGLARGQRGSKARHEAVDQLKAAAGHVQEAQKELAAERKAIGAMNRKAARFLKDVQAREKRVAAREAEHGKLDERAAEIAADALAMQQTADELALLQERIQAQADRVARNDRAATRAQQAADRMQMEARLLRRRGLAATSCGDMAISCDLKDLEAWQVLAHRSLHGAEAELEEVEAILTPDPEPTPDPTVRPQRGANRKRRRRTPKTNVVSFPGGR